MAKNQPLSASLLALTLAASAAACHHEPKIDVIMLNNAGMSYDSVQQLKGLKISTVEIPQVIEIHNAGVSDSGAVELVRIFRSRNQQFDAADTVANMIQSRVQQSTILELARMNQLGVTSGELLAIHLAGLPDPVLIEVARRHAANQIVLSGASLASIKNTGVRNSTLLELVRRGVPDSQAPAIVAMRRHRGTDADILRHFAGTTGSSGS
jgi:hypothetical protein